jgi:hypothetical protein
LQTRKIWRAPSLTTPSSARISAFFKTAKSGFRSTDEQPAAGSSTRSLGACYALKPVLFRSHFGFVSAEILRFLRVIPQEVALNGSSAGKAAFDVTVEANGVVLSSSTKRNPSRSVFMEEFKFMVCTRLKMEFIAED